MCDCSMYQHIHTAFHLAREDTMTCSLRLSFTSLLETILILGVHKCPFAYIYIYIYICIHLSILVKYWKVSWHSFAQRSGTIPQLCTGINVAQELQQTGSVHVCAPSYAHFLKLAENGHRDENLSRYSWTNFNGISIFISMMQSMTGGWSPPPKIAKQ